jgi:GDP-4-dehydro-6-deoxy-D-mannose reductase
VLVTGAAGFAGGHLIDLLRQDNDRIVAWRRPTGTPLDRPGVTTEAVNLMDRGAVRDALARMRPSVVYHCAGLPHVGQSWDTAASTCAVNVLGTHHVVEGLRDAGLRARVLIPSSAMVYAGADHALDEEAPLAPRSPYALSKLAQELLGSGNQGHPDVLIARPFNHIGPRQDPSFSASGFARRIAQVEASAEGGDLLVGNLSAARDLTDVRDTVRGYRAIMERGEPGRPYNVCSGQAVVIRDLLDSLLARARVPIRVIVDPARYRPHDQPLLLGSRERITRELGWEPQVPLEQTLDDLLAYWRAKIAQEGVRHEDTRPRRDG